jgi:hypothetical protein
MGLALREGHVERRRREAGEAQAKCYAPLTSIRTAPRMAAAGYLA